MNGYEVTIIADGLEPLKEKIGQGSISQIPISMRRDPSPWTDLRSLVALIKYLRRNKPDILTYATPKASLLGAIAGFLVRVPVRVYQLWGLRLETTRGAERFVLAIFERLTSLLSTKVLANSRSLAYEYGALGLSNGKRIDVQGEGSSHGVDVEHFSKDLYSPSLDEGTAARLKSAQNDLIVGFVGRLHPDKGIDILLSAARLVRASGTSIKLLLVGSDEGAPIDLAGGLDNDVIRVGSVLDTRPYYAEMDVLVLPSLREGFPNVVLEAAAMEVPAIVSNGTGVIDSVNHEVTGLIVPINDPDSLAKAILRFASDPNLNKKFGRAARIRAEVLYDQTEVWTRTFHYLTE